MNASIALEQDAVELWNVFVAGNNQYINKADRNRLRRVLGGWVRERIELAKLAAKTPQFFNPLEAAAAEFLRDRILAADKQTGGGA
jgi:hypothetical protein